MATAEAQAAGEGARTWADLLADGRLPRFALICLGVWLNAADSLVTATIMPSVGAQLGGYQYFSWATAGYFVGAILAGASAGRLSEMFGLRMATTIAGLIMAGGCVMSAVALSRQPPTITTPASVVARLRPKISESRPALAPARMAPTK